MKQYIAIPAILFLLVAILACEKVVDFQQSAYKPKLVIYGALFQDSVPEIMIGKTQTYYGWEEGIQQQAYVEGATVSLSEGQNSQTMPLGGFKTDFFNVWEGLPSGYSNGNSLDYYRVFSPADSTYRVYEGNQALKGGTWYEFDASLAEDQARRSVYIPQRPTGIEVDFIVSDTSYTEENFYGEGTTSEVDEKRFLLRISYNIEDNENIWHKPVVTYEQKILGYYLVDRSNEFGAYQYIEDSILAKASPYSLFEAANGPGRKTVQVQVGSVSARTFTYPDGYVYNDTSFYFPATYERGLEVMAGDTLEVEFKIQGMASYAQGSTIEFVNDLLTQRFNSNDPFNFSEPVIVNANEEEGLGLLGGFAESETEVVKVKFYR